MTPFLKVDGQALVAPLMLQVPGADGALRRIAADDITAMDDSALGQLARTVADGRNIA